MGPPGWGSIRGAGASPLFPPKHRTPAAAAAEVLEVIRRPPRRFGLTRARWWLTGIALVIPWLRALQVPAVHRLLGRLKVRYKRGRRSVHSPDPEYGPKMAAVRAAAAAAAADPARVVLLYEDELTYYRRPTVARGYAAVGADGPRADQGHRSNTKGRVIATFEPRTGRVIAWQRSSAGRATLIRFYRAVEAAYPEAGTISIAQDNWPVHFHPDVTAALQASRITLLRLPTYAPWTNPVEKVWRKLYEDVLHLHTFSDRWDELKAEVAAWLTRWSHGSEELRRYVGCSRNNL